MSLYSQALLENFGDEKDIFDIDEEDEIVEEDT